MHRNIRLVEAGKREDRDCILRIGKNLTSKCMHWFMLSKSSTHATHPFTYSPLSLAERVGSGNETNPLRLVLPKRHAQV